MLTFCILCTFIREEYKDTLFQKRKKDNDKCSEKSALKSERSERKQKGLKSIDSTMTSSMLFRTWKIKNESTNAL